MRKWVANLFYIWLGTAAALHAFAVAPLVALDDIDPQPEHRRATRLITHFLANYHYKKAPLNDELSQAVLARYLEALDPTKSYFLQTDIDEFQGHARRLDDYLRTSDLDAVFDIFVRFRQRLETQVAYALAQLDQQHDFSREEEFVFDRSDADWPITRADINELWRKRVKNDILTLRLAGKKPDAIRDTLTKRYRGLLRRTAQLNNEDIFQIFINAYTTAIDPHTAYFSPRTSENFKIRMSLSLEGIGAVLQSENEFTVVREIVPGGPADLSQKLHAEDRIVGIGQGKQGELVDVIGWRLDDVVDLIRGPKDSIVQLQILPKNVGLDGPTETIKLTRNTIQLEEQAAQKSILELDVGHGEELKLGVIEIPTFYMDFEARMAGEENYRSTTRDVRKLIGELNQQNVAGLLIDLRSNGGGSLAEATELTGLFIDTGPVVQVRNSQGRVQLERDTDEGLAYTGPLVVLVDRNSASASEIFAGAIQDYRRGVIVGEATFGKGTVQNLVDLNRFDEESAGKLGQLKATIAQFFRVQGGSTQHRGVIPDINFPTGLSADDAGERALDNALPWAEIPAARFTPAATPLVDLMALRRSHERRVANDDAFQALLAQERAVQVARDKKALSLVESERKKEYEKKRHDQRVLENRIRTAYGLEPLPEDAEADEDVEDDDIASEFEQENDKEYDVILKEAGHVLADMILSNRPTKRVAEQDTSKGKEFAAAHTPSTTAASRNTNP